jgi:hypothetical protein
MYFTTCFKFIYLFVYLLSYWLWSNILFHIKVYGHILFSIFTLHWEWNVASCFTPDLTNSLAYADKIFKLCNTGSHMIHAWSAKMDFLPICFR